MNRSDHKTGANRLLRLARIAAFVGALVLWSAAVHAADPLAGNELAKSDKQLLQDRVDAAEAQLRTEPANVGRKLTLAKLLYFQGVADGGEPARRSEEMLIALRDGPDAAAMNKPLLEVYLGSLTLLRAARTFAVWNKASLADEGLAMMDKAVALSPDNPEIVFIRGVSTYHLPFFFGRGKQSAADFAWLAPRAGKAFEEGTLDAMLATAALYHHGLCVLDSDKNAAIAAWREAAAIGPQTPAGRDAIKQLRKHDKPPR